MSDGQLSHAKRLFNAAWDYLDMAERTEEQEREMLAAALGSWHHWRQVGEPRNLAISDWQVSRVFAVLGDAAWARRFAQSNLDLCEEHGLDAFVTAYAQEALARAAALAGDDDERERRLALARARTAEVEDAASRELLEADLATI